MKIFKRSIWTLTSLFFGILFAASLIGQDITNNYAGWINFVLKTDSIKMVDDSDNATPDVMYYKSPFIRTRWHLNPTTGKYELEVKKNLELAQKNSLIYTRKVDEEGAVLLKNEGQTLPLQSGAKVSLYGISTLKDNYIATGEGSGFVSPEFHSGLKKALEDKGMMVNPRLSDRYEELSLSGKYKHTSFGNPAAHDTSYVEYKINEAPFSEVQSVSDETIASYSDAAIFVISRLGSENGDTFFKAPECSDENYQDLSMQEEEILSKLQEYKQDGKLSKIVVLLNTANAMQFKHLKDYDIDSLLYVGLGGSSSFAAIANLLSGEADPNGRLSDTYLYDSYSCPATLNFGDFTFTAMADGLPSDAEYTHNTKYVVCQEGIYVGYRYYETRYEDILKNQGNAKGTFGAKNSLGEWKYEEEVAYPFGYGSSYATFEQSNFQVTETEKEIVCRVKVKNTSTTYSGKDVFQVYLSKPYTSYDRENGVEKSAIELVGFAKTKLLKPNETQDLEVRLDKNCLCSYDANNKKTYILEKGDYYFSCGKDVHSALNQVLSLQGVLSLDSNFARKIHVAEDDFETYSISQTTKEKITNQFDDVDINKYEATKDDQHMTYLSRNNWKDTYPNKSVDLKCVSPKMIYDMQYGHGIEGYEDKTATMPEYNKKNGIQLIDLLYRDFDDPMWEDLLDQMSQEEQIRNTSWGANSLASASSIAAPGGSISDGPAGVRNYNGAVAYSSQTLMANTFNQELIYGIGTAFGDEMMVLGCNALYGPGAGIHRCNFSGRNWEYYSEDPILSSIMHDQECLGLTSKGVIVYSKHCFLNDQERNRNGGTVWANEQSIREVFLKPFQFACQSNHCNGIMTSLNRIGTCWAGGHKGLMSNVLRKEWGFKGTTITDAAVTNCQSTVEGFTKGVLAGQTLWLGGFQNNVYGSYIEEPVVARAVRGAVKYNLYTMLHSNCMNGMKSGIKIVQLTPWWQVAIAAVIITSGILMGISLMMSIVSFLLPLLNKRKEKKAL